MMNQPGLDQLAKDNIGLESRVEHLGWPELQETRDYG